MKSCPLNKVSDFVTACTSSQSILIICQLLAATHTSLAQHFIISESWTNNNTQLIILAHRQYSPASLTLLSPLPDLSRDDRLLASHWLIESNTGF